MGQTAAHELGGFFRLIADAAGRGISYGDLKKEAKAQFGVSGHQTETKKAAFQEFGLAYVVPRSDSVSLTPAGAQLFDLARTSASADAEGRRVLLLLGRALSRYQFQNPFPAGAKQSWADSTDVLPYLATYYLLTKLDGLITTSELFGAVFGLQRMRDLPALAERIAVVSFYKIPATLSVASYEFKTARFTKEAAMNNLKVTFGLANQRLITFGFCVRD